MSLNQMKNDLVQAGFELVEDNETLVSVFYYQNGMKCELHHEGIDNTFTTFSNLVKYIFNVRARKFRTNHTHRKSDLMKDVLSICALSSDTAPMFLEAYTNLIMSDSEEDKSQLLREFKIAYLSVLSSVHNEGFFTFDDAEFEHALSNTGYDDALESRLYNLWTRDHEFFENTAVCESVVYTTPYKIEIATGLAEKNIRFASNVIVNNAWTLKFSEPTFAQPIIPDILTEISTTINFDIAVRYNFNYSQFVYHHVGGKKLTEFEFLYPKEDLGSIISEHMAKQNL